MKHECGYCRAGFKTITEHMVHVVSEHDTGKISPRGSRTILRPSTCWSCRADVWPNEEKKLICSCGFDLGEAWSYKFQPLPDTEAL